MSQMRVEIVPISDKKFIISLCSDNSSIESGPYTTKWSAKRGAKRLLEQIKITEWSKVEIS